MRAPRRPLRPQRTSRPLRPQPAPSRGASRTAATALLLGGLLGSLVACSDDGAEPAAPAGAPAPSTEAGPPPLATRASIATVTGRLPSADRARLQERVVAVVDAWIDAAFTAGEYPRPAAELLEGAFAGFTPVARERATRDRALMSNAALAEQLDGVRPTRRQVRLDVLAVRGRAVGVTARTVLELQLSGEVTRRDRVAADLFLTYVGGSSGGWRVFGYDVTRGRA